MNIQFAVKDGDVYILEVNPRASRTVPFVAKATGVPVARIAAKVMAGEPLAGFGLVDKVLKHTAVKESVFPFGRFPGVDVILGPEMKSTGEVMGLDQDFALAFAKAQLGAGVVLPQAGTVFVSVKESDKPRIVDAARDLVAMGFHLIATKGTAQFLSAQGVTVEIVHKVAEGRPHIVDLMRSDSVALVINTTEGALALQDSFSIRRTAVNNGIPYYTTLAGAKAAVAAIRALRDGETRVMALQGL